VVPENPDAGERDEAVEAQPEIQSQLGAKQLQKQDSAGRYF